MAKLKRRKSSIFFSTPGSKKSRGKKSQRMGLINAAIAVMSLLLVAFIFSFSGRQTQSGVPIEVKFPFFRRFNKSFAKKKAEDTFVFIVLFQ